MVDAVASRTANLNADALHGQLDRAALEAAIQAQGAAFQQAISLGHEHLFADVPLLVATKQFEQILAVIAAVEQVVTLPGWRETSPLPNPLPQRGEGIAEHAQHDCLGVFYGYDFHLNEQGAYLIEINSNAGGGFLNALLIASQRDVDLPGQAAAVENLEREFLDMFRNEWRLARGDAPLNTVAIVDEQPQAQYLYPEFLLAQQMFERAGITAFIVDPSALRVRADGLYLDTQKIDLVYNRLTDFDLRQHPPLLAAYQSQKIVLTPNPAHYYRYADKRNLALLTDAAWLRAAGVPQASVDALLQGIPQTHVVRKEAAEQWWASRKEWFFKPASGYGSKGAYRGKNITKRVFEEIMQADYVAQRLALPGECQARVADGNVMLKFDVRCYVYDGKIQLLAARLYQGQTTNFRTPGGGFALVRVAA